ncbi:hypothetical protein RNJ44_01424 [Nakaseomyces bracarensis]|uniref:Uncharacterized protein n=1 Tax=Nakaseomyces bracarensis TaxID=273131 RepID=A0ABR4NPN3_9SACH
MIKSLDSMYTVVRDCLFSEGQTFTEEPIENVIALMVICSLVTALVMCGVVVVILLLNVSNDKLPDEEKLCEKLYTEKLYDEKLLVDEV